MTKLLYVTDGIYPAVLGGMQKVSAQHIEMLSSKMDVYVIYSGKKLLQTISGVTYIFEPWPIKNGPLFFNKYPHQLRLFSSIVQKHIDSINPDLIYTEGPLVDNYLDKNLRRIPIIFHPHGLEPFQDKGSIIDNIKAYLLSPIIKKHCLMSDVVISQGGKLDNILLRKIGVSKNRVRYLQNFFDIVNHGVTSSEKLSDKKYDLIFVGRNEKRKGLSFLLNSLINFKLKLSVCIVGKHEDSMVRYQERENLDWVGELTNAKSICDLYRVTKFLILPSFAEGMPTVLLEAMSQGVPAIAADVGAVSQVIKDGENGFLFKKGNQVDLLSVISRAIALSDEKYKLMSEASLDTVKNNFSYDIVKKQLVSIINELLTGFAKEAE